MLKSINLFLFRADLKRFKQINTDFFIFSLADLADMADKILKRKKSAESARSAGVNFVAKA